MINLPNVTLICVDTKNYGKAINAMQKTLQQIAPARAILFTNILVDLPGIDTVQIPLFYNRHDYSRWMIKELGKQEIMTSHILVIQHDGFVLDGAQWDDDYLDYDYIGAPWLETDEANVGNGGFSLRSMKLHRTLANDDTIKGINPEDVQICRVYRSHLEETHGIKFAPESLAHKFSYELHQPKDKTFGFHGPFHKPYKEPIVIKRTGAMGDVIGVEPVLEYFYQKGHDVYLDTQPEYYQLFALHFYPVGDYSKFDKSVIKHRVINLDMAYEVDPKLLHLKAYYKMAGVEETHPLRSPALKYKVGDHNRLFKKYVVIHIDERDTPHRNVRGVNWAAVRSQLEIAGYTVIQIGHGNHQEAGLWFNAVNQIMLMWLIAGCELFIGVDSGPSHIAVATGKKCLLFFGSVDPRIIHPDLSNVEVMQSTCPVGHQHCWHEKVSTSGIECQADPVIPPCTINDTLSVLKAITKILA